MVSTLAQIHGSLKSAKVVVLGASYRGGVKETAFSGVFPTVDALKAEGAEVFVHDPMYTDEELKKYGFTPYHYGDAIDAAVIQADHKEYADLTSAKLPGIKTLLDGRGITKSNNWLDAKYHVIGKAL